MMPAREESDQDLTAILRGTSSTIRALAKVWPDADSTDLLSRLDELEKSAIAQELLAMVLTDRKIRLQ
jgi:hypothetical protein